MTPDKRNETLLIMLPAIYKHARRSARVRSDADDLAQEACLYVLQKWEKYDGIHFNTYARWMVGRAAARFRNTKRFRAVRLTPDVPDRREPARPTERAEAAAAHNARLARLRAAVEQLPARRREIITRRFGLDGRPPRQFRELVGGLGNSNQAIEYQQSRALAQLALALALATTPNQESARV